MNPPEVGVVLLDDLITPFWDQRTEIGAFAGLADRVLTDSCCATPDTPRCVVAGVRRLGRVEVCAPWLRRATHVVLVLLRDSAPVGEEAELEALEIAHLTGVLGNVRAVEGACRSSAFSDAIRIALACPPGSPQTGRSTTPTRRGQDLGADPGQRYAWRGGRCTFDWYAADPAGPCS
ncbi:MAG: hypothetical protein ACI9K2_003089 [Myxococcota bacterium]|jgi:hypothetical protein